MSGVRAPDLVGRPELAARGRGAGEASERDEADEADGAGPHGAAFPKRLARKTDSIEGSSAW